MHRKVKEIKKMKNRKIFYTTKVDGNINFIHPESHNKQNIQNLNLFFVAIALSLIALIS